MKDDVFAVIFDQANRTLTDDTLKKFGVDSVEALKKAAFNAYSDVVDISGVENEVKANVENA